MSIRWCLFRYGPQARERSCVGTIVSNVSYDLPAIGQVWEEGSRVFLVLGRLTGSHFDQWDVLVLDDGDEGTHSGSVEWATSVFFRSTSVKRLA